MNTPTGGWIIAAAAAIFVLDIVTPLGIAVPVLYVIPILLTWLVPSWRITVALASCSIALTLVGIILSAGEFTPAVAADRTIASALLLVVAGLLLIQKRSVGQIAVAQRGWHASEERLQLFIDYAPAALAMFDRDMRYLAVSRRWLEDYGLGDKPVIGRSHYDVFPEISDRWKIVHRRGLAGEIVRKEEDCFVRANGTEQWLSWEVRPWRMDDGQVGGIIIFTEDITARKQAEEELRRQRARLEDLTSRLLRAQDDERSRIARELHDDHMQRLAALALDLHQLSRSLPTSVGEAKTAITQHARTVERLTTELQQFAHQLHPSMLAHVGLEATLYEHVEEFERRTSLNTEVEVHNLPAKLSDEQALCLFRVLQECLQNVRKHANASKVLVRLLGTRSGVGLCVHDDGRGFEAAQECAEGRKGLGLISLGERLDALNGTFRLRTKPGDGTEVHAWIPLEAGKVTTQIGAET